jgi:hypothetical protein
MKCPSCGAAKFDLQTAVIGTIDACLKVIGSSGPVETGGGETAVQMKSFRF